MIKLEFGKSYEWVNVAHIVSVKPHMSGSIVLDILGRALECDKSPEKINDMIRREHQ